MFTFRDSMSQVYKVCFKCPDIYYSLFRLPEAVGLDVQL